MSVVHNCGLMRQYCSAPTSLLTSLMDNNSSYVNEEDFTSEDSPAPTPTTTLEMETMLAKLISSSNYNNGLSNNSEPLQEFEGGKQVKQEEIRNNLVSHGSQQQNNGFYSFGSQDQLIYQPPQQIQGLPNSSFDCSSGAMSFSMASENTTTQTKMGSANCSNLIRHKSSPPGFFSNYSVDNGFATMRKVGSDVSNGKCTSSTSGLHGTLNLSSRPSSSCSKYMPQIVEYGNEGVDANCVENRRNDNSSTTCYNMPSFTSDLWDDSAFNATKTATNSIEIMFSTSNNMETQDGDFGYQKLGLTHHLSLPSSSTKVANMEKFFHIQGSAPCKTRARRGFATHPRSIAERERRTRISAKIKKLEDLFPKSDKQTSTADILDVAAEYIKDLQKQVKILTCTRAKCICSRNQKQ